MSIALLLNRLRLFTVMLELIKRLEEAPTELLKKRLAGLDKDLKAEIKRMLVLSNMTEEDFVKAFDKHRTEKSLNQSVQLLMHEITEFQRKAQVNLALRYVLNQRGALLESCALPISQEQIGQNVQSLKAKEAQCKHRIESKIEDLIKDTDKMLAKEEFPDELKAQLTIVKNNLLSQLEKIKSGADIEDLVYAIAEFDLGGQDNDPMSLDNKNDGTQSHSQDSAQHEKQETQDIDAEPKTQGPPSTAGIETQTPTIAAKPKPYLIQLIIDFGIWLVAPWKVSWRTIRAKSRYKSNLYKKNLSAAGQK